MEWYALPGPDHMQCRVDHFEISSAAPGGPQFVAIAATGSGYRGPWVDPCLNVSQNPLLSRRGGACLIASIIS